MDKILLHNYNSLRCSDNIIPNVLPPQKHLPFCISLSWSLLIVYIDACMLFSNINNTLPPSQVYMFTVSYCCTWGRANYRADIGELSAVISPSAMYRMWKV